MLSMHSGMLLYHKSFKPRFGFGRLGANQLQLSSMLFAVYQCAIDVNISDPFGSHEASRSSSGLNHFWKDGNQVSFVALPDKRLLLIAIIDGRLSRSSSDIIIDQLRVVSS